MCRRSVTRFVTCIPVFLLAVHCSNSDESQPNIGAITVESHTVTLPDSLTNQVFVELTRALSEVDGVFPSDNFTSNESSYLHPITALRELRVAGGVYVGVGPEQNFTYIAEIKPAMAFIVDIRRQNLLLHLIYKALFKLSNNRAEFLSKLLSKPLYKDLSGVSKKSYHEPVWLQSGYEPSLVDLIGYFDAVDSDKELYKQNLAEIKSQLHVYGVNSKEDLDIVQYIFLAFFTRQLDIQYDTPGVGDDTYFDFPNLRELLLETTFEGEQASFLGSESAYKTVMDLQRRNLVIPVVGDFAGETSLKSISEYVRSHDSTISVFYVSNVELYLTISSFNEDVEYNESTFARYFENVVSMPIDDSSLFIRSYANDNFNNMMSHPHRIKDHPFTSIVQSMSGFVEDGESLQFLEGYDRYIHIVTQGMIGLDGEPSEASPLVSPRIPTLTSILPQKYNKYGIAEIIVGVRFTAEGFVDTIWTEKPSAHATLNSKAIEHIRRFRLRPVMGTQVVVPTNMVFKYRYRFVPADIGVK